MPYRKQSVFMAPSGLSTMVNDRTSPSRHNALAANGPLSGHGPLAVVAESPPKKLPLPKANAQILEQHISKIISENAAIVETLDPLWSKRFMSRHSTCGVPPNINPPAHHSFDGGFNGLATATTSRSLSYLSPPSHLSRRYSESSSAGVNHQEPLSKLQSALLGKPPGDSGQVRPPPSTTAAANNKIMTIVSAPMSTDHLNRICQPTETLRTESSKPSVIINAKDKHGNIGHSAGVGHNVIVSGQAPVSVPIERTAQSIITESIVRNLLTAKGPTIQVSPPKERTKSPTMVGQHPQNPEGSIIKDLLLKSRDDCKKMSVGELVPGTAAAQGGGQHQMVNNSMTNNNDEESSMLVYVCTVCQIAFRNKENLEVHQVHYCKGTSDDLLMMERNQNSRMDDLVQRKVSVMARPNILQRHLQGVNQNLHHQQQSTTNVPNPPVGNILKQQLLAPNQGPPAKKRKISEPVFRSGIYQAIDGDEPIARRVSVVQQTKSSASVLHSTGSVITLKSASSIPTILSTADTNNNLDGLHKPVNHHADDLVTGQSSQINYLPAYLPHLTRPQTKITIKGPLIFPVLKNIYANKTNLEFAVVEDSTEPRTSTPLKQVASLPPVEEEEQDEEEMETEETESLCKPEDSKTSDEPINTGGDVNKEVNKENSAVNNSQDKESEKTTAITKTSAIRPRSLSLKMSSSSLIGSTLISPDTPRSKKNCVQMYINGHAYTHIGLKVNTRTTFCCIYRAQPMFVIQEANPGLSMYCNWQASPVPTDDICSAVAPGVIIGQYKSHRPSPSTSTSLQTTAGKCDLIATHSSYWQFRMSDPDKRKLSEAIKRLREDLGEGSEDPASRKTSQDTSYSGDTDSDFLEDGQQPKRVRIFEGGFKSNEDYTYVRGRGRGKYVCEECGIRCKKPSMLKKHIRTHTDLRPYSCRHCAFAFKTKGNLTKHMKSKAHHKKCVEMGIIPVPVMIDDSQIDSEALAKQEMLEISCGGNLPEDEDDEEDEGDEDDDDEDDEGVPISLIELERFGPVKKPVPVPGQFDDAPADNSSSLGEDSRPRTVSETDSAATESEEQEAARSLLILSGSGSESDLTAIANGSRKSVVEEPTSKDLDSRKTSLDASERGHRVSLTSNPDDHRRQSLVEKLSKDPEADVPAVQAMAFSTPSPSMVASPRKLSPIEQLQQQVKHQQLLSTTWTPNCDVDALRPRSFSFNDATLSNTPGVLHATLRKEMIHQDHLEPISDDTSSNDSFDYSTARRFSMSVIADKRWNRLADVTGNEMTEQPMDLSVSAPKPMAGQSGALTLSATELMKPPMTIRTSLSVTPIPAQMHRPSHTNESPGDGKCVCSICQKVFSRPSQLRLHINIHYFERPFRCDSCAVSFRTKGHLQKHKRSVSHFNKVNMNMTFGTPTTDNPRPFKCADCKIAFRIHGHLAKHLRSKMHIMKLECLGKLPFGMYAEMERSGINLNEIDTTDCDNSLLSLQALAQRLYDPRQMRWASEPLPEGDEEDLDDEMAGDGMSYPVVADGMSTEGMSSDRMSTAVKIEPDLYSMESKNLSSSSTTTSLSSPTPLSSLHHPPPASSSSSLSPFASLGSSSSSSQMQISANQMHSPQPLRVSFPSVQLNLHQQPETVVHASNHLVESLSSDGSLSGSTDHDQLANPAPSSGFTATRSNTCHLCGRLFKAAKFLQVHLYCDHQLGHQ